MSGGCGSGFGISGASFPEYKLQTPPSPGPGCTAQNINNTSCTAGSAAVMIGPIAGTAGAVTSSADQEARVKCNPSYEVTQLNDNKLRNETTIDQGVTIMTNNTLKSISSATNQMIVNSITNTSSSATQSGTVSQTLSIRLENCGGDATIRDVSQVANINMEQISSMSLSAIDNVRTDLASSILDQFNSNISNASKQTLSADMTSAVAAQNMSSYKADVQSAIREEKKEVLPSATDVPPPPENLAANVNLNLANKSDITNALNISAPFSSSITAEKVLQSSINNSVTQNFTKNTVNVLVQTLSLSQSLSIEAVNIGGDCTVERISQVANIAMRQTMSSKMDIGTAIVNSIQNSMGIKTDDSFVTENLQKTSATTKNDLRLGNTAVSDMKSEQTFTRIYEQHMGGLGSSGSSGSSCICCIICIICILSCGLGGLSMSSETNIIESSSDSDTSSSDKNSNKSSSENSSSSDKNNSKEGGFFSFF